jgi:hypothetical protein
LCTLICGAADAERQGLYRRYAVGWFDYYLRCDASFEPWVHGTQVDADLAAGVVTYAAERTSPEPCEGEPPGEVGPVLVSRSGSEVTLHWPTLVAQPAVSAYRLYRSEGVQFATPALVGTSAETAWSESPPPGSDYCWRVRAVNALGEGP